MLIYFIIFFTCALTFSHQRSLLIHAIICSYDMENYMQQIINLNMYMSHVLSEFINIRVFSSDVITFEFTVLSVL